MITIETKTTETYRDTYESNGTQGYALPKGIKEKSVYLFGIRLYKQKVTFDTDSSIKLSISDKKIGY